MPLPPIRLYGDPVLTAPNAKVERFGPELAGLVGLMLQVAWAEPGLGLAAPQIGRNLRLAVVDLSVGKNPRDVLVLANPVMVEQEGAQILTEGCLSFPGLYTRIRRPEQVLVRAQDLQGRWQEHEARGKLAQAFCHELDHLDGILLPDHLSSLKRQLFLARVRVARLRWKRSRKRTHDPTLG